MTNDLREAGVEIVPVPEFSAREAEQLATGPVSQRAVAIVRGRLMLRRRLARTFDAGVCLVQRNAAIWPTVGPELEAIAERRFVFDVDDALWIDGRGARGQPLAVLKFGTRRTRYLARRADHTIAATPILAEWLEAAGGRVTVVPSVVDTRVVEPRVHEDRTDFVVGWIGSPSTAGYLGRLVAPLEQLARLMPDRAVRLLVVGGRAPRVAGVTVDERAWSETGERAALAEIDVGVLPMPDTPWTRGKAAYKALLYMAAGIPVVADHVGVAPDVVRDGDVGAVVGTASEWTDALQALGDSRTRTALGTRGREHAERNFSVEAWAPVVASILRGDV